VRLAADAAELVDYALKPNLPVLGPKMGKQIGQVRAALEQLEQAAASAFVAALGAAGQAGLTLADGKQVTLAADEVLVETRAAAGFRVEQEGELTVALNTVVDDELRDEGLAREIVHAVQLARKSAGLRIEDTISLALTAPAELQPVIECYAAVIKAETLASEFNLETAASGVETPAGGETSAGATPRDYVETARVEGHELIIGISATGTIFTVTYG